MEKKWFARMKKLKNNIIGWPSLIFVCSLWTKLYTWFVFIVVNSFQIDTKPAEFHAALKSHLNKRTEHINERERDRNEQKKTTSTTKFLISSPQPQINDQRSCIEYNLLNHLKNWRMKFENFHCLKRNRWSVISWRVRLWSVSMIHTTWASESKPDTFQLKVILVGELVSACQPKTRNWKIIALAGVISHP